MSKPRIWISNANPAANEVVRVRALVEHRMESGLRLDSTGEKITRNIVNKLEAKLDGALLFTWQPETAVSQNPYIEFTFVATQSGELQMQWVDDEGHTINSTTTLTVKA